MHQFLNDFIVKRALIAFCCVAGLAVSPLQVSAGHRVAYDYDDDRDYVYRRDGRSRRASRVNENVDTNSCIEGSVIGGLLGAGLGAALSRGNGRWIGVPVGGAAGALVGCQVDGG